MMDVTLQQLQCFDAVVTQGSFQAAAETMRRAQPSISLAVKNLEVQLGLSLLDRSGYRVSLTEAGRSFHARTRMFLHELHALKTHATQLAMGEESELRVVIGDLCPLPESLALLRRFFDGCPGTRLHLHFEAISGPWERLFDSEADLIIHHIDKSTRDLSTWISFRCVLSLL
jgi:DNA-binding transcriptional LysR family regulator